MKKKKQFIDKKNAANFHIVQRTQGGNHSDEVDGSKYVLQPTNYQAVIPEDFPIDLLQLPPEAQEWNGFPGGGHDFDEDDYDYEQHMRPMGDGGGTFFQNPEADVLDVRNREAIPEGNDEEDELDKLFDEAVVPEKAPGMRVTQDFFDALEGEGDFEEIADDFMLLAREEDEEEDEKTLGDGGEGDGGEGDDEYDYFEDEDEEGESLAQGGREKREVDKHFDTMLEYYDSEEDIGELDPENPDVQGTRYTMHPTIQPHSISSSIAFPL